mgnify:FL=1
MKRPSKALTSLLVLGCAASGALAGRKTFSIQDDVLAYPQV